MSDQTALPSTIVFQSAEEGMAAFNTANLVFSPVAMTQIQQLSSLMAGTANIVPRHFANNPGACFSIIMQAGRWGMDPFALAQHTFDIGGKLGFEAKVMQSVLQSAGGIKFKGVYNGDWSKVRGKTVEREGRAKGPNEKGKKYRAPNWNETDEIGLNIELTGTWPDGRTESMIVEMNSCHPRQSTNWANDPEQQVWYSAIKKFGRRFAPELLLGVNDRDDISARQEPIIEKEVNPIVNEVAETESTLDQVMQEEKASEAQGLDDILADQEGYVPTKFEELRDLLIGVNTKDEYKEIAPSVSHSYKNGKITEEEHKELIEMCKSLYQALQGDQ